MRPFVSRFLLLALLAVGVFALARGCGDDEGGGVVIEGVEAEALHHRAFEATRPVRVVVEAAGSFEDASVAGRAADTALAAYGWIVRRRDGAVVWRLSAANARRGRGTLAEATDTLALAPGVYDAYFTSYGDPDVLAAAPPPRTFGERMRRLVSRDGRAWLGDAGRWRLAVRHAAVDAEALDETGDDAEEALPGGPGRLWAAAPLTDGERRTWLFEVRAPGARVRLRAVTEVAGGAVADRATLERLGGAAPDTVWALRVEGTTWAGGARRNRRADTTLALARGLYRVTAATDGRHAWDDWVANPPFVPAAWGLTMEAADAASAGTVAAVDPWRSLPRLASFACSGPEADRRLAFTLPDTTEVLVHAEGEVTGSTVYDGARLLRRSPGGEPEPVWEMTADETRPAGGSDKNRMAEATLTLPPGTYTFAYFTDDSHQCAPDGDGDRFNADPPDNPERWGATLFVLDPGFDLRRVAFEAPGPGAAGEAAAIAAAAGDSTEADPDPDPGRAPGAPAGALLARLDRLGNDTLAVAQFRLDRPGAVRVYAVGELVPSARFDYGWITSGGGTVVWEMTRANTRPAGGSAKNRVFDGRVELPAGTYMVGFRTDARHAYGRFEQPPPDDPEAWGIRVERMDDG